MGSPLSCSSLALLRLACYGLIVSGYRVPVKRAVFRQGRIRSRFRFRRNMISRDGRGKRSHNIPGYCCRLAGHAVSLSRAVFHLPTRARHGVPLQYNRRFQDRGPHWRQTLTLDNGIEFRLHEQVSQATGIQIYFAHPCAIYEWGRNDNTNGLLRQYLPKSTDLRDVPLKNSRRSFMI